MLPIRKVLYATDHSELSRPAFELACAFARDFGADLVVCHVAPVPLVAAGDGVIMENTTDEIARMTARLGRVRPDDPGVRVVHRLRLGDPASEIVQVAADEKADLIVVGTHGRGGVSRLLLGSVAEELMRHAPCPVVTVRAAARTDWAPTAAAARAGVWND